ncbi:toll/interleukin-1 receptor domain-containing protein [Paenarthrobacter sp. AR 02]|uniref:toll/interleukin-1 receptor domain-containing protein n=1 Tax=Paenarthrobacter sp. AR 02 TaxID=2899821 RepID=UPI001F1D5E32|nr:toll/interleukin-1 receptor domain-containing protein [Paenarthrobacter sp. AR 02]MCF3139135.1 toll/interleukin-1 receptor domain-containing protein [Paenarthrobacter sp. AR 02]
MDSEYEAFWSYTHEDDDRMSGYVRRLAQQIANEYAVSSGNDLQIFLDRNSLSWGEAWRTKIGDALGTAPFFIAVVTPKFVKSPECRRELLTFVGESTSRGFAKLLLPILLINVPDMREDSDDEVLALLARTQYVDWTKYRLMGEGAPEVLTAVNQLALRIMQLQEEAQADLRSREQTEEQDEQATVDQVIGEINTLLPDWVNAVDFDPVARRQWNAAWAELTQRASRVYRQQRGLSGQFLSVWAKLGSEIAPLSDKRLNEARNYHRLTIALDPHVTAAIRLVEREPRLTPLLADLRYGISEAMLSIRATDEGSGWTFDDDPTQYSSKLRQAVQNLHNSEHFVAEANDIVSQWDARFEALGAYQSEQHEIENPA